jgi:hypothetical protein
MRWSAIASAANAGLWAALTVLNERQLRKLRQGGYPQGRETRSCARDGAVAR